MTSFTSTRTDDDAAAAAPNGGRERNRRGQGSRLRTEILTNAGALLDETGTTEAVTLRAVARRIGIAAPSIYSHFPDRDAILLAVVADAFTELAQQLTAAARSCPSDPAARLTAVCAAYLDFAANRPQRYRAMFGGMWNATDALDSATITRADVAALGQDALTILRTCLHACVAADRSTSTNPHADAVALWLGLHGLAHQRAVTAAFPWPADIAERLITSLAHMTPPNATPPHQQSPTG